MRRRLSWVFLALLLTSLIAQMVAVPLSGTSDVTDFRIWTYYTATEGPTRVYGTGGSPPAWRWLTYGGHAARVDYPPFALDELALVGRLYQALFPTFPDTVNLTIAIKLLIVLAGVGLTAVIFSAVSAVAGAATGRWAALAYWANPAVILNGAFLGYLDSLCALPALGALVAAASGIGWATGALLALSVLTKPQGILVLPALVIALSPARTGSWSAFGSATLAGGIVTAACLWPIVHAGAFWNMCVGVGHLLTDGSLSANAANLWWLVTYAAQTAHGLAGTSLASAVTAPVELVSLRSFLRNVGASSSLWIKGALAMSAWASVIAAVAWATWQVRRRTDLPRLAALAAFTVHAYVVLSVQVHENHIFLALPFLAIVATGRPRYWGVLVAVSVIAALNLNLFYGLGEGVCYAIPRSVTGIDATVVLAVLNCAAFAWHAVTFHRECATHVEVSGHTPALN